MSTDTQSLNLRGSLILTVGKGLDLGSNFVIQVLLIRQLTAGDFGAFAYGNALASLFGVLVRVGQGRAVGRLVPTHLEADDRGAAAAVARASSLIVTLAGVVFGCGVLLAFGVLGLNPTDVTGGGLVVALLILQAPVTSLSSVAGAVIAAHGAVKPLFVRDHILVPLAKSSSVVAAMAFSWGVELIAAAWLVASALGAVVVWRAALRLLRNNSSRPPAPVRAQLKWGVPVMGSDLLRIATEPLLLLVLQLSRGTEAVAELKVLLPLVFLNLIGAEAFKRLFYPDASRLLARGDAPALERAYWRTAAWTSAGALPVTLVSVLVPGPVLAFLYGAEHRGSAHLLSVLAVAYYVHASAGLNTATLKAASRFRWMYTVDVTGLGVAAASAVFLIPMFGVSGAAVAMALSVVAQNVLANAALRPAANISPFISSARRMQATAALALAAAFVLRVTVEPSLWVGAVFASLLSLLVIALHHRELDVASVFSFRKGTKT